MLKQVFRLSRLQFLVQNLFSAKSTDHHHPFRNAMATLEVERSAGTHPGALREEDLVRI